MVGFPVTNQRFNCQVMEGSLQQVIWWNEWMKSGLTSVSGSWLWRALRLYATHLCDWKHPREGQEAPAAASLWHQWGTGVLLKLATWPAFCANLVDDLLGFSHLTGRVSWRAGTIYEFDQQRSARTYGRPVLLSGPQQECSVHAEQQQEGGCQQRRWLVCIDFLLF